MPKTRPQRRRQRRPTLKVSEAIATRSSDTHTPVDPVVQPNSKEAAHPHPGLSQDNQDRPPPWLNTFVSNITADMGAAAPGPMECPVCHDGFTLPKLLPCTHLVCHKCVVAWIEKRGNQAGCPLCRKPILPASCQGQDDIASLVDALPTDFATAAMVESEKRLSGSRVCSCCEDAEGTVFCLQCAFKLCKTCSKFHAKMPTSRDHITEKLSDLTAEQLATHHKVICASHSGKQAELYCTNHEELVCMLCASSTHHKCLLLARISELAKEKREELKTEVKKLEDRETAVMEKISQLDIQVSDGQAKFKAMKDEVKATFDDLQMSVEAQRQKLNLKIQRREDAFLAERKSSKLDLEDHKGDLSAHRSTAQRLISTATDSSLLAMVGKLKSRLAALESQVLPDDPKTTTGSLTLNSDTVKKTKKAIAANGQDHDVLEKCLLCGEWVPLEGPEYAAVIKVGDRVGRGRDWCYTSVDGSPPGEGTVTEVPDNLKTETVSVLWDCQQCEYGFRMGLYNRYDLRFVSRDYKRLGW